MKNFYYELLTSTLSPEFDPKEYIGHDQAINELVNNLNISVDETQEMIDKIKKISAYQNSKIAEIDAYTKVDFVRLILCAVSVASVTFMICSSLLGVSPLVSFILSMVFMSTALSVNIIVVRMIGKRIVKRSISRGSFAEHALNTLYAKRQQKEFFTRADSVYSRADFDRLLDESRQLIVARSI